MMRIRRSPLKRSTFNGPLTEGSFLIHTGERTRSVKPPQEPDRALVQGGVAQVLIVTRGIGQNQVRMPTTNFVAPVSFPAAFAYPALFPTFWS